MHKYDELRKKFPVFSFDSYTISDNIESINVRYKFSISGLSSFEPEWNIPKKPSVNIDDYIIKVLIFNLGLVELISYWKITCSPNVVIKSGFIDENQIEWWKKQYFFGLGEFFYTNGINAGFDSFMAVTATGKAIMPDSNNIHHQLAGNLIPVGGGKDSAVTIELLKHDSARSMCYIINPRGATEETAKAAAFPESCILRASRTLDSNMLKLNKEGYLNGHTPFSAIVAFSSVLTAYMNGLEYSVLSNESSANESTVSGSYVNHQYSKSFQFEKDFCDYEKKYINSGVKYFSLLRPLSELQIAKCFAKYSKYHSIFKSCNAGSKQNIWCCNCPKCLFVYIILSPFLPEAHIKNIFGENLLQKESLTENFNKLTGIADEKPFECVGSRDEVNTALCMTIRRYEQEKIALPKLLVYYKTLPVYDMYKNHSNHYDTYFDSCNLLENRFESYVKTECF